MSTPIEKPRPTPIAVTKPFWDGLAENRLRLQRCRECGNVQFYPRVRCIGCLSDQIDWFDAAGTGTIYTFTVARQPTHPSFADELPQLLGVVELAEGPRMTATFVDIAPDELAVGLAVEAVYDHGSDGITLLRFRPA